MQTPRLSRTFALTVSIAACVLTGCSLAGREFSPNPIAGETMSARLQVVEQRNAQSRLIVDAEGRTAIVSGSTAGAFADLVGPTRFQPDTGGPYVYVGNSQYGTTANKQPDEVLVYANKGMAPVRVYPRIAKHWPGAFAFDASGNLYVAYYSVFSPTDNGLIVEYARGTTKRIRTISQGIFIPNDVAVDASDNVYAANDAPEDFASKWPSSDAPGTVTVYAPGNGNQPQRTIKLTDHAAAALAFDGSGNLFVASYLPKVFRNTGCGPCGGPGMVTGYVPESSQPFVTIHNVYPTPDGLAIDNLNDVYVCNDASPFDTAVYSTQGSLLRTLPIAYQPITFNANVDRLYVASSGDRKNPHVIDIYKVGKSRPSQRIRRGVGEYLTAVATDPLGNVYDLNLGLSILTEFAPDGRAVRQITQGLSHPYALAVAPY